MKNSFGRIIVILMCFILFHAAGTGQPLARNPNPQTAGHGFVGTERAIGQNGVGEMKALRKFVKEFADIHDEIWSKKPDGLRATFKDDGIQYLVDYNLKGSWVSTIRYYDETRLPIDIRTAVRSAYFDYSIVRVIELNIGTVTSYFVKLDDGHSLKTVRIINGEFEVVEDLVKI